MKLRILGNSIRIRIQQQELATLAEQGSVQDQIQFGPENTLVYSLAATENTDELDANYQGGRITVFLPKSIISELATTDRVGVSHEKSLSPDEKLSILIEKDFKCLTDRPEDADAFPHPDQKHSSC